MTSAGALFETIPCPLCGQADHEVRKPSRHAPGVTADDLRRAYSASSAHQLLDQVVRCRGCSMQFVNPRPNPELIIESYSAAEDPKFVAQNEERIHTFEKFLRRVLAEMNWPDGAGRRFLDVGCAGGASLVAARNLKFQPSGVEPSRWMADFGRRTYNVDIQDGILEPGRFAPGTFDIITTWDVLEHVPDPNALIQLIRDLLKPGGLYVLTYPDAGSLPARLLGDKWPFWLSVHLLYYDRATIRRQLEKLHFEVMRIEPYDQTLKLGYVLERATPYVPPVGLLRPLIGAIGLSETPFTYNIGQTIVIARKPG